MSNPTQDVLLQTIAHQQEILRSISGCQHSLPTNTFSFNSSNMVLSESSASPTSSSSSRLSFSDASYEQSLQIQENFDKKPSFRIDDILKQSKSSENKISRTSFSSTGSDYQRSRKVRARTKSNETPMRSPKTSEKVLQFGVHAILSSIPRTKLEIDENMTQKGKSHKL